MNHSSIEEAKPTPDLPFKLSGSQAKTAYAIEVNAARMISEAGLEKCGFLTLTVGDETDLGFQQVWDAAEASRRINSLLNILRTVFKRSIIITERHKSGAIHFHLIVECSEDIRPGFDFEAFFVAREARRVDKTRPDFKAEQRYEASATPALRALWAMLRSTLPDYGFGRAELTPIYKTGEAVARYVSKYVEKNLFNRLAADKGKKLVRYSGWNKSHLTANAFSWANERAAAWRTKARQLAEMVGADRSTVAEAVGSRWSFRLTRVMHAVDNSPERSGFKWQVIGEEDRAGRIVWGNCSAKWRRARLADERRQSRGVKFVSGDLSRWSEDELAEDLRMELWAEMEAAA